MISSLIGSEPSGDVIAKSDYIFWYDGTLAINDDRRIPKQTKNVDVYIDKLEVDLQEASTGADVIVTFYKNGVSMGSVTVTVGTTHGSTVIAKTLSSAGDIMTVTIDQIGTGKRGISATMYMRITSS